MTVRRSRRIQKALYILSMLVMLGVSAFLLLEGLGTRPFDSWDEARHGQSAWEMLQSGDYIVTTYLGETDYWNLKPPLSFWADALGFAALGYNPMGLRIVSAGLMLLTYALMAWFTRRRYGRWQSLGVLWMYCACDVVYALHFARTGQADGFSNAFYLISLMALIDSDRDVRRLYVCALCFGLSFMARSWHAFLIPMTCFVTLLLGGRLKELKLKHWLTLIALALLPILPWAVARYLRDGWTFFQNMLEYDLLKRSSEAIEGHTESFFYYFTYLRGFRAVALSGGLCLMALVYKLYRRERLRFDQLSFIVAAWLPLLLFTFASTKIDRYAFPTIAVLLLAGGISLGWLVQRCIALWRRKPGRGVWGWRVCASLLLAVALIVSGSGVDTNVRNTSRIKANDPYQNALFTVLSPELCAPDGGPVRIYMEFEDGYRSWRQSDILMGSIRGGNVTRMDGGLNAFLQDPGAWIVLPDQLLTDELRDRCLFHYDDSYVCVLELPAA